MRGRITRNNIRFQRPLWANSDIGSLKDIGQGEGRLTEEQLKVVLRRYNTRNGLVVLGRVSVAAFNDRSKNSIGKATVRDPATGVFITQYGISYLANILLISGANDWRSKEIGEKENLLTLLNIYSNDLIAPELVRDRTTPFTNDNFVSVIVRMYKEQFEYQFDYVHFIARNIVWFGEMTDHIPPSKFESLRVIFERETGLTFEEYFLLVFTVWAATHELATFRKEVLTEATIPSIQTVLTDEKVTNFLKILSVDYKTFREIDTEMNQNLDPILTKYRFNPLVIYPIIKTDKELTDLYVVPCTMPLLKRGFGGLYWWFHKHFEDQNKQLDFRDYFGSIFEQYVGKILKEMYGEENVRAEIIYNNGSKFIDWAVEKNGTVYLFEAKAYQFAFPTKQTGDNTLIFNELKTKVVKAMKQVYERLSEIDKYQELAIFRGKKIVPVIVFLDIPLVSGHLYKKYIDDELDRLESQGLSGIKTAGIHLMNIEELEAYGNAVDKIPLEEVFERYKDNMQDGFMSVVNKELQKQARNPYLHKIYKDFWGDLSGEETDLEDDNI